MRPTWLACTAIIALAALSSGRPVEAARKDVTRSRTSLAIKHNSPLPSTSPFEAAVMVTDSYAPMSLSPSHGPLFHDDARSSSPLVRDFAAFSQGRSIPLGNEVHSHSLHH
ncbi:hypothetical protein CBOM_00958 [Ceraceosorus bombacis]|uniref:Uncharacterized protein n=1 Tax=Ceraceosorus bombacis TaxID=401625 RepID=A0A0P1BB69_9BASI|nr:hypothetical protein CBOM_00958 [Ceraceosorus bombacis]